MSNTPRFPIASWAELKERNQSFSLKPALSQTKPISTVRSVSLATDVRDEGVTASDNVSNVVEESEEAVDEGMDSVEDDHEVLKQIAIMEKRLLDIWEHGPAKLSEHQDTRILVLEEQLAIARSDSLYLESLLHVRDQDFARYVDLERKQRRQTLLYAEKVDHLEDKLEEKDHIIISMQAKLDCMREADRTSQELHVRQQQLSRSTMALFNKVKKTKMASTHSVQYTSTKPRPPVQDEIAKAERREWERMKEEQRKEISAMVNHVDRIVASYDRYQNVSTIITFTEPRSVIVPDHLFTWVDKDLIAMWVFSIYPTQDEQEKYEKHLEKQMRPDPIYSPNLVKPRVNWSRLNTNMLRNLPIPTMYAVQGCAQDPEFYTSTKDVEHYGGQLLKTKLVFESGKPFGSLYGFWTSQGVLAPPEEVVHGYHCCPQTGTWVIAAEGG